MPKPSIPKSHSSSPSGSQPPSLSRSSRSSHDYPAIDGTDTYELQPILSNDESPYDKTLQLPPAEDPDAALLPSPRRFSVSSIQSYELYTPDEDKRVRRKLDRRLVSFMALLYCLSFLDRSSECCPLRLKTGRTA